MRNINDVANSGGGNRQENWPPVGWHAAQCVRAEQKTSKNKGTPYIELGFVTVDDFDITDNVFQSTKSLNRLAHVTKELCGYAELLSDNDLEAADALTKAIMTGAMGKVCDVKVEEYDERYVAKQGPRAGEEMVVRKKRVAFRGYRQKSSSVPASDGPPPPDEDAIKPSAVDGPDGKQTEVVDDLPF